MSTELPIFAGAALLVVAALAILLLDLIPPVDRWLVRKFGDHDAED